MRYAALALALLVSACAPAGPSASDGGDAAVVSRGLTAQPWASSDGLGLCSGSVCVDGLRLVFSDGGSVEVRAQTTGPMCSRTLLATARWTRAANVITISGASCTQQMTCDNMDACPALQTINGTWRLLNNETILVGDRGMQTLAPSR